MNRTRRQYGLIARALLLPLPVGGPSGTAHAAQEDSTAFKAGGSLRLRYEYKEDFRFGAAGPGNSQDYLLSQLRLNFSWQPGDTVRLFVEGQDARVHTAFRDNAVNDKSVPNIFADDFDLHQGYLDVNTLQDKVRVRVGRQKFNLGAQRLIASLEWVNTARVWDGIRTTTELGGGKTLDLIASRLVPVRPKAFNDHAATASRLFNSRFFAIYYADPTFRKHTRLEGYLLLRHQADVSDEVYTAGARFAHKGARWDADGELARQFGTYGGLTHRATLLHLGAGYTLPGKTHIGVAYNFGSGDDDAADGTHGTFDNQYPLNHAYYGYMDFFSLQNVHNLEVVLKRKLAGKVSARLAVQHFRLVNEDTDAWYNAGAGTVRTAGTDVDPTVGTEVDLTFGMVIRPKKLGVNVGYSHFFPGDYVKQTGAADDADFLFVQAKVTF